MFFSNNLDSNNFNGLLLQQRGKLKEEEFVKKIQEMAAEEEKQRVPIAQGLPWTTDEPEASSFCYGMEVICLLCVTMYLIGCVPKQKKLIQLWSHVVMFAIAIIDYLTFYGATIFSAW